MPLCGLFKLAPFYPIMTYERSCSIVGCTIIIDDRGAAHSSLHLMLIDVINTLQHVLLLADIILNSHLVVYRFVVLY